jgi:hypothetical protein
LNGALGPNNKTLNEAGRGPGQKRLLKLRKTLICSPQAVPATGKTCDNNGTSTALLSIMQESFSDLEYAANKRLTRRDRFLAEIDKVTPWGKLHQVIERFYPTLDATKIIRRGAECFIE